MTISTLLKSSVSSETHDILLTVTPCKNQNQKTDHIYFQHTVAQDIHYRSKWEKREHSEEILDQSKIRNQLSILQNLHLHVSCQSALPISNSFQFC